MRSVSTGPSTWTPISSPIAKSFFFATPESITTWSGPGHFPSTSRSGLNGESPSAIEKPRFGAPPKTIALPSLPISEVESLSTLPSAVPTPSSPRTSPRSDSGSVGSLTPLPSERSNAALPVTTTSEPWRTSVKILSNALSIESVRT